MRAIIKIRLIREAGLLMIVKNGSKIDIKKAVFGCFFAIIVMFNVVLPAMVGTMEVSAVPETTENQEEETVENENDEVNSYNMANTAAGITGDQCQESLGSVGWLVCPVTNKIAEAVDWLHGKLQDILEVKPISTDDNSPIYMIWKYLLGVTNVVFIVFLLVVIYSQITGIGISNYGLKKVLPKLIVAAVLVNLSFLICSLAVDVSNIFGNGLRGVFTAVEESVMSGAAANPEIVTATGDLTAEAKLSYADMYSALAGGSGMAVGGTVVAFETGAIWMLIPVLLGAIVAVASGLITIALRQAVVVLLIMISPLAMVAYMLPNTENLFKKWKQLFIKMLVFYPMFSLLFGASSLAGFAIIASAKDGFGVLLGTAVQIFPLFFSWSLMKMSGTFLGTINAKMQGLAARPLAANRAWAESRRLNTKQKNLALGRPATPSLRLMQFMSNKKIAREAEISENSEIVKNRALAYNAAKHYDRRGRPTRDGERAYEAQARNMSYQQIIARDKNNMNKGLGQLEAVKIGSGRIQKARLKALDTANVLAADSLKAEQARGERIEYENAMGFHKRMEDAINVHFDDNFGDLKDKDGVSIYKRHFDGKTADEMAARARYKAMADIMEGNAADVQYIAATAAHGYDTQRKIIETKMQKYFELTPPTKDLEYRLGELTKSKNAIANIDSIIPGLRILNQRGDTDLVKKQLDNILDKEISGGIELGTHASQALASFLMFEVKDNDPFLRRFGKYINLETAKVYNNNERKVMNVTYDEYIKGYHDGEVDLISSVNSTGRMYAKKGMKQLVEGTSLDNVERTAFANLDESLKKAYGYDKKHPENEWDVNGYLRKREDIQTAIEPAFLSAMLKWASGSEQMNSGVKFWTGYEAKQKKKKIVVDGKEVEKIITDKNGDPEYELSPVWDSKEFKKDKKKIKRYFRRKVGDYLRDQTPQQILQMRTDIRDAIKEHMVEAYKDDYFNRVKDEDEVGPNAVAQSREYDDAERAIMAEYQGDLNEEQTKERDKKLNALKMEFAGRQVRQILGPNGTLEQILSTSHSSASNAAKAWNRKWLLLDDTKKLNREVKRYKIKRRSKTTPISDGVDDTGGLARIYDADFRENCSNQLESIWERHRWDDVEVFRDRVLSFVDGMLGDDSLMRREFERRVREEHINTNEALKHLADELINNPDMYPDS